MPMLRYSDARRGAEGEVAPAFIAPRLPSAAVTHDAAISLRRTRYSTMPFICLRCSPDARCACPERVATMICHAAYLLDRAA